MSTESGNDNLENQGAGAGEGNGTDNTNDLNKNNDGTGGNGGDNSTSVTELNDEVVSNWLKTRSGKEFGSIDELFVEKTIEVDNNPYKDILEDAEAKSFLDYKKETGRGLNDYLKLQENIEEIPVINLAIAKVESELGKGLKKEDIVTFIEEETGVDIESIDELTDLDNRKLNRFVKDYRDKLLAEQEKYRTPLAKENTANQAETITLENGITVTKQVFEDHQNKRQAYQKDIQVAVDSVAKTSLSVEIENAGKKETLTFDYEYDAEDKKEMLSMAADLDQTVGKLFKTESGFNHAGLTEALLRFNPKSWEKMAAALAHKVRAATIEELTKAGNNVNLDQTVLPNGQTVKEGTKIVHLKDLLNR